MKFFGVLLVGFTQKYKMNIKFSVKVHSIQGLLRQSQMLFSSFLYPAFLLVNCFFKSCLEMWVSSDPPPLTKRQGLVEVAEFAVCRLCWVSISFVARWILMSFKCWKLWGKIFSFQPLHCELVYINMMSVENKHGPPTVCDTRHIDVGQFSPTKKNMKLDNSKLGSTQ